MAQCWGKSVPEKWNSYAMERFLSDEVTWWRNGGAVEGWKKTGWAKWLTVRWC